MALAEAMAQSENATARIFIRGKCKSAFPVRTENYVPVQE